MAHTLQFFDVASDDGYRSKFQANCYDLFLCQWQERTASNLFLSQNFKVFIIQIVGKFGLKVLDELLRAPSFDGGGRRRWCGNYIFLVAFRIIVTIGVVSLYQKYIWLGLSLMIMKYLYTANRTLTTSVSFDLSWNWFELWVWIGSCSKSSSSDANPRKLFVPSSKDAHLKKTIKWRDGFK